MLFLYKKNGVIAILLGVWMEKVGVNTEKWMRKVVSSFEECMEVGMSPAQREVFLVVDEWWKRYGFSPTLRDIAYVRGKMGLGSTKRIVDRLVALGVLKKLDGRARTLRPVYVNFRNLE